MAAKQVDKTAIGLGYAKLHGGEGGPPKVIAKGYNDLAEEIIAQAKAHNILVHEDPELADLLQRLEVGDDIPDVLYVLIAELIAFAVWLDLKA